MAPGVGTGANPISILSIPRKFKFEPGPTGEMVIRVIAASFDQNPAKVSELLTVRTNCVPSESARVT
jgi:hypothetical protein